MHANEQLLRDLDQAQIGGDIEAFSGFFVDVVGAHFPGKSSLAGEYKGKGSAPGDVRTLAGAHARVP
jgi:hypothetical protein